jgi:hypothetical protein
VARIFSFQVQFEGCCEESSFNWGVGLVVYAKQLMRTAGELIRGPVSLWAHLIDLPPKLISIHSIFFPKLIGVRPR